MQTNKAYVFVCCGAKEHVETLSLALKYLRPRTSLPIYIITDNLRNEIALNEPNLIDIKTPAHYTHHQASIWLKTSLHTILPPGNIYAYLDTDVLAIGKHADDIFDQYLSPIRFAADHCRMSQFSPSAVTCHCLEDNEKYRTKVNRLMSQEDPLMESQDETVLKYRAELQREFQRLKKNKLKVILTGARYVISRNKFQFTPHFYFDKKNKVWCTSGGLPIMYQVSLKRIAKKVGLRHHAVSNDIQKTDGQSIWRDHCTHLKHNIKEKFNVLVRENDWQHWNGGVFLFSDESQDFMDTWHAFTLEIFTDKNWKTRDQGTLIATVWKWALQNHPVLDDRWNFIADFYNPLLDIDTRNSRLSKDSKQYKDVEFVHIYHHFGDTNWHVWNWVKNKLTTDDIQP